MLLTDGLAKRLAGLGGKLDLAAANVHVLPVEGNPKSLLDLPAEQVDALRAAVLRPSATRLRHRTEWASIYSPTGVG